MSNKLITSVGLTELEIQARERNLLLKVKVRRPLNIWAARIVAADQPSKECIRILGEMKIWAYSGLSGLQLDTMKVIPNSPKGVSDLIWAATMAWALETTPCKQARLLAIRDNTKKHQALFRYFRSRGFQHVKEVGSSPTDLPLRIIWGGAGSLMIGNCEKVLRRSYQRWTRIRSIPTIY